MPRLLLLPLLLLALPACASPGSGTAAPEPAASTTPASSPTGTPAGPATSSTPTAPRTEQDAGQDDRAYVGLTEQEALAEAERAGRPARVVERDGESFPQTMDLQEDRLNLTVQDGRVTAVRRG